jgi:hypothetical protein
VTAATPAPPPIDAGLEQLLRRMRLPHMRAIAPEILATAKAQRWDPAEVLRALLAEEVAGRDRSALATRRARAAFPTGKTFDAWEDKLSSIPAPTQAALRTVEWIGRHENLVVCRPSGTGRTFLLEAPGQAPSKPASTWPGSPSSSSAFWSAPTAPAVSPQRILLCQANHQAADARERRRAAGLAPPARVVLAASELAVPGQERRGRHGEDFGPALARNTPCQRGEPHPVARLVP